MSLTSRIPPLPIPSSKLTHLVIRPAPRTRSVKREPLTIKAEAIKEALSAHPGWRIKHAIYDDGSRLSLWDYSDTMQVQFIFESLGIKL